MIAVSRRIGSRGFTLIELMIVVAIIGILSAIAYPSYQNYTKRAHVAEGLVLAQAAKVAVSEYYATKGTLPSSNAEAGLPASITGNAVTGITVGPAGEIQIAYGTQVDAGANNMIRLFPNVEDGSLEWYCARGGFLGKSEISANYLPSSCNLKESQSAASVGGVPISGKYQAAKVTK